MQKRSRNTAYFLNGPAIAIITVLPLFYLVSRLTLTPTGPHPSPTPWHCIGGCGLGGSGGGNVSAIRRIGKGVQGYILSAELLPQLSFGSDYSVTLFASRMTLHPRPNTEIGLVLPVNRTIAEAAYQENLPAETHINSGLGDLTLDGNYTFGSEGTFSAEVGLTFPIGKYDARRGYGLAEKILPRRLQTGRGIYEASLRFSWIPTFENSLLLLDASFHYPFNVRLNKRNEYLDTDYRAYRDATKNRERFYYRWPLKPYGESDRGDYYPPSLRLEAAYGWFRDAAIVHSLQVSFSASLGTSWVCHWNPSRYDPYPDPDHSAWQSLISYGMEISQLRFPLFFGAGLPICDRKNPDNRWDGIDHDALFREWIFVAGIAAGIF